MNRKLLIILLVGMLVLSSCSKANASATVTDLPPTAAAVQTAEVEEPAATVAAPEPTQASASGLPPANIVNDEGGPARLVGSLDYKDFSIPTMLKDPAPALLDMVNVVRNNRTEFAPINSQILGFMTAPIVPPPLKYAFDLPIAPTAILLDVDNDGQEDTGVQIFNLVMGANINMGSHQEQLDQAGDLFSILTDPTTGQISEGSLLVFAPDDAQGFPGGFGADGALFTADDPAVGLPQGYTVVHFGPDGFTFDRSAEAVMNVLEREEAASPDFSDQGIVESFNNLIDHLAERYSFTELRNLDWEALRAEFLPRVEEAEQAGAQDPTTGGAIYGVILHDLAQRVRDAHVISVFVDVSTPTNLAAAQLSIALQNQPIANNVGANTVELNDGRIIVTDVVEGSAAAEAGWTFGVEIVAVDGIPVAERIPSVVYNQNLGTDEAQRLFQVSNLLKFPAQQAGSPATPVTIDAILPGATTAQSFTLTPAAYPVPDRVSPTAPEMPIRYKMKPNSVNPSYAYLTWANFTEPEVQMAVLRQFLADVKLYPNLNGVVLDLRGNSGGWDLLWNTMASYFFSPENPVSMYWTDQDSYNPAVGDLVREKAREFLLSAPEPELYYGGPIVILIDQNCASSCEFFTQFMQTKGRATVVGQYASAGAGAPINRVSMPFGITFQYTKGRSYFAGTDVMNLEGKGVVPDVRAPVTQETESALLQGQDPVLEAGVNVLYDKFGQALVDSLVLTPIPAEAGVNFTGIAPEGWSITKNDTLVSFTGPGQQQALTYDSPVGKDIAAILAPLGVSDPATALEETRLSNGLEWSIYKAVDANNFGYRIAAAEINGQLYLVTLIASANFINPFKVGLLYPAIDAFIPPA